MGFPGGSIGKESACNAGDLCLIPGLGKAPGEGIGYPLQYLWAFLVAQLVKYPPALQEDFSPAEPPGKPRNTGVGSLSLLQGIFPTQESNYSLLHCRQILYQLSYQGSPLFFLKLYANDYVTTLYLI